MQAFAKYLDDSGLNCTEFARRLGVKDSTVWRWRYGTGDQRRSPSLALALRIEELTKGAVPVTSWAHDSSKPVSAEGRKPAVRGGVVRRVSGRRANKSPNRSN